MIHRTPSKWITRVNTDKIIRYKAGARTRDVPHKRRTDVLSDSVETLDTKQKLTLKMKNWGNFLYVYS